MPLRTPAHLRALADALAESHLSQRPRLATHTRDHRRPPASETRGQVSIAPGSPPGRSGSRPRGGADRMFGVSRTATHRRGGRLPQYAPGGPATAERSRRVRTHAPWERTRRAALKSAQTAQVTDGGVSRRCRCSMPPFATFWVISGGFWVKCDVFIDPVVLASDLEQSE